MMKFVLVCISLFVLCSLSHAIECGRHSQEFLRGENYIIGGRGVRVADSVVSFQVFKSDEWWNDHEWKHVCGGALLNTRWVLTAAHCAKEFRDWGTGRVAIGKVNLTQFNGGQIIKVRRVIEHPKWISAGAEWDIALVELQRDVRLDYEVSPACVSSDNRNIIEYESCAALGWGRTAEFSDLSDELRAVNVNLMTYSQCMRAYRNMNGVRILPNHICAGRLGERDRGICQGDLGGPLFCRTQDGVDLVGVATNGAVCGSPQYPGVYIRIDQSINWIRETTGDQSIGSRSEYTRATEDDMGDTTSPYIWQD